MKTQENSAMPLPVEEFLICAAHWDKIDQLTARESQSSRPETEMNSYTANSTASNNPAVHPASQNRNSGCTAVPTNPENGVNTVPMPIDLMTFEDRIQELELRLSTQAKTISLVLDRLERLEYTSRSCKATSDKTLADHVQPQESWRKEMIQKQMDTDLAEGIDLAAPSSIPPVQSAHCSASQSTKNEDQACAKTNSRRDILWAEFDREYKATLATVRAASASIAETKYVEAWLPCLRNRLKNLTDTK